MTIDELQFSKGDVDRAGKVLASLKPGANDLSRAIEVFTNWRSAHLVPIGAFQSLLRERALEMDPSAITAQRLKREPSVIDKLRRPSSRGLRLSEMQDIGGLRAIVQSVEQVGELERLIVAEGVEGYELIRRNDYIANPKPSGYRGVHLVFRKRPLKAKCYERLSVEVQLRTRLQHAWATAVEFMGSYLRENLKASNGDERILEFFAVAGAALATVESREIVQDAQTLSNQEAEKNLSSEYSLAVLRKIESLAIGAELINRNPSADGDYILIESKLVDISGPALTGVANLVIAHGFKEHNLDAAVRSYADIEARARRGEKVEALLMAVGAVKDLRDAYPSYFADCRVFVSQIRDIIRRVSGDVRA